jgi:ferric-dicitrate binding protein FerR (iron transport regulator)
MIDTTNNEQLIARYLNGDLSAKEEKELIRWVNERSENKKLFFEIKDTWDASLKIKSQEPEQLLLFYKKQATRKSKVKMISWLSAATVAAVLIIGMIIGNLFQNSRWSSHMESFSVPMGSRSWLILADGTKVNLNSDSRLVIDDHFSPQNRIVTLMGEGYFEVKADEKHLFTVKTVRFDITVTGTKFNVSSYADDDKVSATLTEGHIRLSAGNNETYILKPGEKISFDQKTMSPSLEKADVGAELAWVNGDFIFREVPFPDLIRRLERWYDVKLTYKGSEFNSMRYSGRFKNQETIWQVLDALKLTSPIDYKRSNFREFELIYRPM